MFFLFLFGKYQNHFEFDLKSQNMNLNFLRFYDRQVNSSNPDPVQAYLYKVHHPLIVLIRYVHETVNQIKNEDIVCARRFLLYRLCRHEWRAKPITG